MNGNLIKRSHTIFGTIPVLFLAQLLAVQLEARDLVWQPHAAANQTVQATTFKSSTSRIEENARLLVNGKNRENATGPAVVALQAEIDENAANTSLEPIPVAHYQRATPKGTEKAQVVTQASFNGKPRGRAVYPEGPIYPPSNFQPQPVVQPWHPDILYASSGAAPRNVNRADTSVLTPEPVNPEAISPEFVGSEEILPEDLGPGEILIPDGTNPMEVGTFSDGCCPDCGGSPCGCDPDWGYPLPAFGTVCIPFLRPTLEFVDFSIGAESFAGPSDQGVNHNFGFNETINLSGSWLDGWVGWQVGARFVQADFNGMRVLRNGLQTSRVENKPDMRHQEFFTLALFHRATEFQPWQGGLAVDFMEDHFYYKTDLTQLRVEVSRRMWWRLDFGTWLVFRGDSEQNVEENRATGITTLAEYQAADQYTLFLQWAFPNGGEARLYGGGGNDRDGIIGGYFWSPLSHSIALTGNFGYLFSGRKGDVPGTGAGGVGRVTFKNIEDAYGLSLNIAWYPHKRARIGSRNPYRALFPVANNGTFFVKRNGIN